MLLDEINTGVGSVLSVENIAVQKDVTIVKSLTESFQELINIIKNEPGIKENKVFKNRAARVVIAKIDEQASKRFGINFRTIESNITPLGIHTTTAKSNNVLAGDVSDVYSQIKDYLKFMGSNEGTVVKDDIDSGMSNYTKSLKAIISSIDAVERKLNTSNIVADLKNAKIIGYPKDAVCTIHMNPYVLIKKVKLTAGQLTAAYLHEVGHAFTHIEYAYRTVTSSSVLAESLLNEVNRGTPAVDAIKLSYKKATGDDSLDDKSNIVSVVVGVTSSYLREARLYGGSYYGKKDSERVADQFAARFGLGAELEEALRSMRDNLPDYGETVLSAYTKVFLIFLILGLLLLMFIPLLGMFMLNMTATAVGGIIGAFIMTVILAIFDSGIDTDNAYESDKRRALSLKNELVRQLRTEKLDKAATKAILDSVDTMTTAASMLSDDNENAIYRVVGKLFSSATDQKEMRKLDDLVNDLMNNDLHVMANKIKTV